MLLVWEQVSDCQGLQGLTLAVQAYPAQVVWCIHTVQHLTQPSSGSHLTSQCSHTLLCVFSVHSVVSEIHKGLGWSPPEWYFYSGTLRPYRTYFGMWWHKNIYKIDEGVRPTLLVLEDCVGLEEASWVKPTHSLTDESCPWFCLRGN